MNENKELLTHSSLKTFRTCHKKYYYQYECGLKPIKETEPQYFGTLWHNTVASWCTDGFASAINNIKKLCEGKDQEYLKVTIIALLEGYAKKYENDPYEIIEIEKEFLAPLLNPETMQPSRLFDLAGKVDAIYGIQKRKILVERKTTSEDISPDSDYWMRLQLDLQISGYYLGAKVLGHDVESCLYDVVKRPYLRPYKATPEEKRKTTKDGKLYANQREVDETPADYYERLKIDILERPNFYFARREMARSESDLNDYLLDVWDEAQTLRTKQLKQNFSRNPDSCVTVYGQCPYFGVCAGMARIDDETLFKKSEKKHKELTQKEN